MIVQEHFRYAKNVEVLTRLMKMVSTYEWLST